MIRTLIVDDDLLFRAGVRMMIEASPDVEVVGEAADGVEAIATVRSCAVDLVLMDINMPNLDGVEATRRISTLPESPKILILTSYGMNRQLFDALAAGATGFLLKDTPPEGLIAAISSAHNGTAVVSPQLTRKLVNRFTDSASAPSSEQSRALSSLTMREREVLCLIGRGKNNTEIADELFIAEVTVKTHVGRVLRKINARDRVQAVVLAHSAGLVTHE